METAEANNICVLKFTQKAVEQRISANLDVGSMVLCVCLLVKLSIPTVPDVRKPKSHC